jgi:hypothetical protein
MEKSHYMARSSFDAIVLRHHPPVRVVDREHTNQIHLVRPFAHFCRVLDCIHRKYDYPQRGFAPPLWEEMLMTLFRDVDTDTYKFQNSIFDSIF